MRDLVRDACWLSGTQTPMAATFLASSRFSSRHAARLIEEARRKDTFRGVAFRATSQGRIAYVAESPIHLTLSLTQVEDLYAGALAGHFGWQQWKAESVLAYAATRGRARGPCLPRGETNGLCPWGKGPSRWFFCAT